LIFEKNSVHFDSFLPVYCHNKTSIFIKTFMTKVTLK